MEEQPINIVDTKVKIKKDLCFGEFLKTKLVEAKLIPVGDKDIFVIKYDQEDQMIAADKALSNGLIALYKANDNSIPNLLKGYTIEDETPTTCLRWRPSKNRAKQVLVSGNSDGSIIHWHAPSGKRLHKILEEGNSVLALDFNFDGSLFASAGKDFHVQNFIASLKQIRVYDDDIKTVQHTFLPAYWSQRGHSNRVFAIKFLEDQPNVIISGGWDANLIIWDIREKSCVGQFYGPSISGDALDYQNSSGLILSGSYRTEQQIQLWDFRTRKLFREVKWMGKDDEQNKQIYVYSCQFSKMNDNYIIAGCSGRHEVKIFDCKNDYQPCASVLQLDKGVYSVDLANTQNKFIFASGDGNCYEIKIQ